MGYKWDVFISYRRMPIPKRWMEEMFLPFFKDHLGEALGGREVKIFKDTDGIEGGANWSNNIKNALATSRCLVPILIPSYFHSEWCTKEIAVIHYRQEQLGFTTVNNPNGLIVPLKIHDGDFFPKIAQELQISDFNEFYRVGAGVESTDLYVRLQDKLLVWIESVAKAINRAPDWNPDWLTDEWLETSNEKFLIDRSEINIQNPTL